MKHICIALGALLLMAVGCEYAPYPEGEPQSYEDCIKKSTKNFENPDPARAMILTEKACKEKFKQ